MESLGAGAEGYRRWDVARRVSVCAAAGAEIDQSWNDGARQHLCEAFMATGTSYAETRANTVLPWMDEQVKAWKQTRTEVCLNAEVRAVWNADLVDRALWCLEDQQMELTALVTELGRANATAARAGAWKIAAIAATNLVRIVGEQLARHGDGRVWARHAEVARIGGANGPAELKKLQIVQVRWVRDLRRDPRTPWKIRRSATLTRIGVAPASCGGGRAGWWS